MLVKTLDIQGAAHKLKPIGSSHEVEELLEPLRRLIEVNPTGFVAGGEDSLALL